MSKLVVVGIDPGLRIGLAVLRVENGKIIANAKVQVQWGKEFVKFIDDFTVSVIPTIGPELSVVIVMEDFALLERRAIQMARNKRSRKMEAAQVIGAVKLWCAQQGLKLVMQDPQLNPMNAKASGIPVPRDHSKSDHIIAYNHAHHYLLENGYIKHRILED